ncbi:MAG: hypothetical protein AAF291_04465 [Pseudomonadota bacterium]
MKRAMKWALRGLGVAMLVTPTIAQADVIIGPRFAYYFDNSNLRTSDGTSDALIAQQADEQFLQQVRDTFDAENVALDSTFEGDGITANQIGFTMAGLMVNFGDDRDRFTISGMYGTGSGDARQISSTTSLLTADDISIIDLATQTITGTIDYEKLDIEATWQRRQNEQFAIFAGVRYERIDAQSDFLVRNAQTDNILSELAFRQTGVRPPLDETQVRPLEFSQQTEARLDTFSLRAGATLFAPFGENAVAFANGMVHASYQPNYTADTLIAPLSFNGDQTASDFNTQGEFSAGPDISVGAQFLLSDEIALDLRYRAILFFPITGEQSFSDARVNHGFNIGVSLRL